MMRLVLRCSGSLLLLVMAACSPTWNHTSGAQTLPKASIIIRAQPEIMMNTDKTVDSLRVSFAVPAGWHRFSILDDLMVTRDGVFLQHLFIERIHVTQTYRPFMGWFHHVAAFPPLSLEDWRSRWAKSLKTCFTAGMLPADAANVLLESRKNDPKVTDLLVQKIVTRTVAGRQAFRAVFDFRLKDSVLKPSPVYRSVYCGFMEGDWFYGISYTAALRHYFEKDADTFEVFLDSIRLVEE